MSPNPFFADSGVCLSYSGGFGILRRESSHNVGLRGRFRFLTIIDRISGFILSLKKYVFDVGRRLSVGKNYWLSSKLDEKHSQNLL